ncbi:hypothetical protein LOC67_03760 [Stieleria sp. JC731]|uniref:hypothetical protein n=1 Tax=Pirellulaceae TaxID=2691357 RepID=UPI001E44C187|nr:hypothetical protein [Stieleria sp. JC731]MCC9599666.1 hypothetical protein [Stieleria sp. JC731]
MIQPINVFRSLHLRSLVRPLCVCCAVVSGWSYNATAATVTDPTPQWTPIVYSGAGQTDYYDDQQTGNSKSIADLVGNINNPSFYYQFDDGGTVGSWTDGSLLFRVRLGAGSTTGFSRNVFVGIDGNQDGALDLYAGVHNQGSADELAIYGTGSDLNISPSTTSITGPLQTFAETSQNYHYAAVDTAATDVDSDNETDYFLSFSLPFQSIVDWMQTESSLSVNQGTSFGFVLATATQDNSFNQDLNGVPKDYDGSMTWEQLGAISVGTSPLAISAIPEPSSAIALGMCTIAMLTCSRRRRQSLRR